MSEQDLTLGGLFSGGKVRQETFEDLLNRLILPERSNYSFVGITEKRRRSDRCAFNSFEGEDMFVDKGDHDRCCLICGSREKFHAHKNDICPTCFERVRKTTPFIFDHFKGDPYEMYLRGVSPTNTRYIMEYDVINTRKEERMK